MAFNSHWVSSDKSVPLGKYWCNKPLVFSLVPALPQAMRIGKERLDRQPLGQPLALGHLFPQILLLSQKYRRYSDA